MHTDTGHIDVFRRGSRTYFTASLFFPPAVREEVTTLYAFVRVADDYVDAVPQDAAGFLAFRERYNHARTGAITGDSVIDDFVRLSGARAFDPLWTEAFLDAMESDLNKTAYDTVEEALGYVYGSAEVVGLCMARILGLPEASFPYARLLGRAMQYINFIRDIDEDIGLGRRYLALRDTALPVLTREYALAHPELFARFIHHHLDLYDTWQREAQAGFALIPPAARLPIKTASDMYAWTAACIRRDPMIVFRRKVKPRKGRILLRALANAVAA